MFWNKKDMVSVSELNYANQRTAFWRHEASEVAIRLQEALSELDTLKASRARSNENLKLGSAASAKARRKKVVGVDWSKPVEAYHPDGRIVRGHVGVPDEDGDREFTEQLDDMRRLFRHDGTGWNRSHQWRIRNV